MATITQPQYDTPIGVGGKIDTNTGKILSGQMEGQQAQLQTPKNLTFAPPASNVVDVKDIGARSYIMPNQGQTNIMPMTNNVPPPSTVETQQSQPTQDIPSDAKWSKLLSSFGIQDSINQYANKGDATLKAQQDAQIAQKREQATRDYNALMGARLEQAQTIERMRTSNPTGAFGGAGDQFIQEYTAKSNADIANLSFISLASQGLLTAAEQTVKDKIDAQFEPIKDKITMLTQFAELNQNDLSESDSLKLQSQIRMREQEVKSVQDANVAAHELIIKNGGDPSVFSELDKITRDYAAKKITAAEAQNRYYAAVAKAGGNAGAAVPTVKTINGVDMQWNPSTGQWETIGVGTLTNPGAKQLETVNSINNILSSPAFDSTFGLTNIIGRYTPGSPAYVLSSEVNKLVSDLALAARGQLKGQGQVSDFEGKLLRDAQTALKINMTPEQARYQLAQVKGAIMTSSGLPATVKVTAPDGSAKYGTLDQAGITSAVSQGYRIEYQ